MVPDASIKTQPAWRLWRTTVLKTVLFAFFLVFLTLQFADPIRLVTADLGRHLKNGELILAGESGILTKNFYSYTQPDYPFINHHWGSGVLFYWIYKYLGGFPALSVFYIGILLSTFLVFFRLAEKFSNFSYAFFFSVIALPIFSDRLEIRPEGISALLVGVYLYLLCLYRARQIPFRVLFWTIPLLQIFWVNTHLFFFMGGFLVAVFFIDAWLSAVPDPSSSKDFRFWLRRVHPSAQLLDEVRRSPAEAGRRRMMRELLILGCLVAVASLVNPAALQGALVPLNIMKEYGYQLAENQSVFFMQKRFGHDPKYVYYEILAALTVLGVIAGYWKKSWRAHIAPVLVVLFFAALGFKAVRSMALFGFVLVPFAAMFVYGWSQQFSIRVRKFLSGLLLTIALAVILRGVVSVDSYFSPYRRLGVFVSFDSNTQSERGFFYLLGHPELWIGLVPTVNDSANFFNRARIQGPVFNNYDIGGYLIFHLFPQTRVFVDNRPEVYSVPFFKDMYVPMQENDEVWREMDVQYRFNAIFFYRHDLTPWGQAFLVHRIRDPQWAPVFVDAFNIIFLRRNEQNRAMIEAFELPPNMFRVSGDL